MLGTTVLRPITSAAGLDWADTPAGKWLIAQV